MCTFCISPALVRVRVYADINAVGLQLTHIFNI